MMMISGDEDDDDEDDEDDADGYRYETVQDMA